MNRGLTKEVGTIRIFTTDAAPMTRYQTRVSDSGPTQQTSLQTQLGRQLRRYYDQTLTEPVPDRIMALIDQLGDVGRDEPQGRPEADR